ncbi:MAG: ferritin [Candidatus Micrarchaeota archaeon]|nr:ferritin [Candidatus Micrarchaeota archaeon]
MTKLQAFVCLICGDAYIGEAPPTHCPFCGAPKNYFVVAEAYRAPEIGKIGETSKQNILASIKLEDSNAEFYACSSVSSKNPGMRAIFKRLSKVEREHATILRKLVGADEDSVIETCGEKDEDNVKAAIAREERAMASYSKFLSEATEPRAKQIFKALIEIENTHKELLGSMKR